MLSDRHRGRFTVSLRLIEDDPIAAREIFRDMIVIRTQADQLDDIIEYVALHPAFDEIDEVTRIPVYFAEIWQQGNWRSVRWTKR